MSAGHVDGQTLKLYHVSELPDIRIFNPRPSPSDFEGLNADVVFAISDKLLHNYLLPRDCPRVTWYAGPQTTTADKAKYIGERGACFFMAVESGWYRQIKETMIYLYEFPPENFFPLDECAGYYVSYRSERPLSITPVPDILSELLDKNVGLTFMPSVIQLANEISASTLNYSLIRMRNAKQIGNG